MSIFRIFNKLTLAFLTLVLISNTYGQTDLLQWDASLDSPLPEDGSGTWDLAPANLKWIDQSNIQVAWRNTGIGTPSDAFFGVGQNVGTGIITVAANIDLRNLTINNSIGSYIFQGSALNGTGSLTVNRSVIFENQASFAVGTSVNGNAALQIGNNSTSGSLVGSVNLLSANSSIVFNRSNNSSYAGVITGPGFVTKAGAGILTFTGNNTYAGQTQITGGTLQLGNLGGTGAIAGNVFLNGAATQLAVSRNNAIALGGVISGTGALSQDGSGTTTLTGANLYSGTTTVNGGVLLANNVSGSATGTGNIIVNAGTLGGTGEVAGAVTVNATGHLAPGASIESLNVGATTLNAGSFFDYEFDTTNSTGDLLNVNGNLAINSATLNLNMTGGFVPSSKFTLMSYSGALTGIFSGFADDSMFSFGGGNWVINYNDTIAGVNGGAFGNFLTITAVPEPSSFALIGLGAIGLLFRRRK